MPIPYVEPEDISELVVFLASDGARYVTGQQIAVDAGCGVKAQVVAGPVKGVIYLETMPVSPDREAEYHEWYNDTHLEEICSVEGITGARRFAPTDGNGAFIAIYELDCDDLDAVVDRLRELGCQRQDVIAEVPRHGARRRFRRSTARSGRIEK